MAFDVNNPNHIRNLVTRMANITRNLLKFRDEYRDLLLEIQLEGADVLIAAEAAGNELGGTGSGLAAGELSNTIQSLKNLNSPLFNTVDGTLRDMEINVVALQGFNRDFATNSFVGRNP